MLIVTDVRTSDIKVEWGNCVEWAPRMRSVLMCKFVYKSTVKSVDRIRLGMDRQAWWAVVKTLMNSGVKFLDQVNTCQCLIECYSSQSVCIEMDACSQ